MIVVNVNAGLANQMFHYAFGRGLEAKGWNIYFDQTNFKPRKEWSFENVQLQDAFPNLGLKMMPEGKFKWICVNNTNKLSKGLHLAMINLHNLIGDEKYIFETTYGYDPDIEKEITNFGNLRNILLIVRMIYENNSHFFHSMKKRI